MEFLELKKYILFRSFLRPKAWAPLCFILLLFPAFLTGCTLKARNQDKFNRLLALSNLSLENSTLTISSNSLDVGESTIVSLTVKDKSSNPSTILGLNVSFSLSGGTSAGTFSPTLDNGQGKYTSVFTATSKGSATTLSATVQELGTIPQTQIITVDSAISNNRTFPVNGSNSPLVQGTSYTFDFGINDPQNLMTLSCTYQTLGLHSSDPNYAAAGSNCSQLNSLITSESTDLTLTGKVLFNSGKLKWTPTFSQRGTYQFTISVSDGTNSSSKSLIATVRESSTTANLLSALDALFATSASGLSSSTAASPSSSTDSASTWLNLIGSASHGSCTFGTSNPWTGTGQASLTSLDPYRIHFNSANSDSINMGSTLSSVNQFAVQTWVKPASPSTAGTIIASNGGGDGNGFALRQSTIPKGKAELVIGKKYYSYRDLVLSDKPVGYWRLGETSGTSASDLTSYGNNGTYTGGYSLGGEGAITGDTDKSVTFNGTSGYVALPSRDVGNVFSLEAWMYIDPTATNVQTIFSNKASNGIDNGFRFYVNSWNSTDHRIGFSTGDGSVAAGVATANNTVSFGNWHHFVAVVNRAAGTIQLYLDGAAQATTGSILTNFATNAVMNIGRGTTSHFYTKGKMDDAAVYDYALTATQIADHYQTGINGNYKAYPGNTVLADKPVGYWRLGEKSGSVAYDLSGNNNHGTYIGLVSQNQTGALTGSGDLDSSISMGGVSAARVEIPHHSSLDFTTGFSVTYWVKWNQGGGWDAMVAKDSWNANLGWAIYTTSTAGTVKLARATGGGGVGPSSSTPLPVGQWTHVAAVNINGTGKIYFNGTLVGSAAMPIVNSPTSLLIGMRHSNDATTYADATAGILDEVAIYNYALSPTQIAAQYNSGAGSAWWKCQSLTDLSSSNWNLLSAIYDGTTAKLFLNGQQECSVTPGTAYSANTADMTVGSNPARTGGFWQGALAIFKIFGTNDSSAPIDATSIKNDFDVEADRFRTTPLDRIITNGLVVNLDAANANQGLAPFTNGCAGSDSSWSDLSSNMFTGTLLNFQSCGASEGWVGDGSVTNPFALVFNSAHSNYVTLPNSTSSFNSANTTFTVSGWFKTTTTNYESLVAQGGLGSANINGWAILINSHSPGTLSVFIKASSGAQTLQYVSTAKYNDNKWHHFAAVLTTNTSTVAGNAISFYVDGALAAGNVESQSSLPYGGNPNVPLLVGTRGTPTSHSNYFTGSIATTQIYNRGLSAQEVKQNCLAQEGRFASPSQSICGTP